MQRNTRASERNCIKLKRLDKTVDRIRSFFNSHLRLALNFITLDMRRRVLIKLSNKDQISVSTMRIAFSVWNDYD
ncbi:hypothetical protein T11_18231 [Trichinella zimbabwensis]|uniref:Uncharacterized protein n=1 Tax=Trichinella zimbabwensis TaxID=268475 RepID=A0A0V1HBU6_9BILA|nr:hypothetical protein T11_18231 [Trichinella zimbabwensis]